MKPSPEAEQITANNEDSLEALAQAIDLSTGEFSLILVRCNYASVREQMSQRLKARYPNIYILVVDKSIKTLYRTVVATLKEALVEQQPYALIILGLESVTAIEQLLVATNQVREQFRKAFHFPFIVWVTDDLLQKMIRLAPDFHSWAISYEFEILTDKIIEFLRQTTDEIFAKVLDAGAGRFLDNSALNLAVGSSRRAELESAQRDLQQRGIKLEPELQASLEFVLGRDASSSMDQSRKYYEQSLTFWQQSDNLERRACLLFCLGLWWRTYAVLHRAEFVQACNKVKEYYQQCLAAFAEANRPDLEAKFINALGEVLQRLEQWDELEVVAKKALKLHQEYIDRIKLAYAYGLLAEVALVKSDWTQVQKYAETALGILVNAAFSALTRQSEEEDVKVYQAQQYHRGWYLLLLAIAQQQLGEVVRAVEYLEVAKKETKPQYDPLLYIRILETLRSLYFKQGKYLEAFEIKLKKSEIEQQYGFCAFIGAGELQPQGQVVNAALAPVEQQPTVAGAIAASRQQVVNYLVERVSRNDCVLTIIHGQSGVGKSSLIHAGLVPALQQQGVGEQDALPIMLRTYTDWEKDLGTFLREALTECKGVTFSTPLDSKAAILEQLNKNKDLNLRTILIFDQFAQLFFLKTQAERQPFWEFLRDCLNLASVRVILAIREDYLHYLLEAERLIKAEGTKNDIINDILSKNNRYYIGNFCPGDAKQVIKQLTAHSQVDLDNDLIDALVEDLAKNSGEVRPIELQIVGAQLQTDKIKTLEEYRLQGPKEKLVQRFLENVIKDCGEPNQDIARLVLYLLTGEKLARPFRTRGELMAEAKKLSDDLAAQEDELILVLKIFVKSGLVLLLQEVHTERYQLIHDYLIDFIRDPSQEGWLAKYKDEKVKREQSEKRRNYWRHLFFISLLPVGFFAGFLPIFLGGMFRQLEINTINELAASSEVLFSANQDINALKKVIKAGNKLNNLWWLGIDINTKNQVLTGLQQAVYWGRERNQLNGHNDTVFSVSYSPDGQMLASASGDNTVKLWQANGNLIKTLTRHQDKVIKVIFSPDGQLIASASHDKTVNLWQRDGTFITTLKGHTDQIWDVSFSPDGQLIATASRDNTVKLWNREGNLLVTLIGHRAWISDVDFSPDNPMVVTASSDNTVKLWKLDGTLVKTLTGHKNDVLDVSFSPDGTMFATASADKTVNLWKPDGTLVKTLTGHEKTVYNLSFSPNSKILATASADNTVKLWQHDGTFLTTLIGHSDAVYRVRFSPNSKILASASRDNTVNLWKLDGTLLTTLKGHTDAVISLSFSPDNHKLASASYDKTVKVWNVNTELLTILQGHDDWVSGVSFSPDGQVIASTSRDNTVKLWQRDGRLIDTLRGHSDWVVGVDFSPDSEMLASASWDKTIKLWQRDGKLVSTLKGHQERVSDVSFSPDGKILASASYDKSIKLWQHDGKLLNTLTGHTQGVVGLDFSPDGKMLASASDDTTIKLWKLDGSWVKTIRGHTGKVFAVAFSPDGQILASASDDNTVKLWKIDGTLLTTLIGHSNWVGDVKFSPDGKKIASASADNTVKLWKRDGTLLITLKGHTDTVFRLDFSPDGQTIASASNDKSVIVWKLLNEDKLLNNLLDYGCGFLSDYLNTQKNLTEEDKKLCPIKGK